VSFQEDLREVIADRIGFLPHQLTDVQVTWDDGDRYDPTYGDTPNVAPTFEVLVSWVDVNGETHTRPLDAAFTFTALLRLALEIGQ
jgi:hypothetical protein